ncbi:hypothetical protein NON00_03680 [Roseomonas sp. GC11]|uniref:hypothetical protein n=1 Tax=Roseomonas sp. GC11 TaxID=2950546 RepID=UPI00210C6E53|nr:hypothetical protein [Roseomonas sp. GC11]MCQ4159024.1 hypothetical protein [Roseomonas sp. GC11]
MRIRIGADGMVVLEEPGDFRRFGILAAPGAPLESALAGLARVEGQHAWVSPQALRRLAPQAGLPDWEEGFGAMLGYAGRKGWTDPTGAVRAHIEIG